MRIVCSNWAARLPSVVTAVPYDPVQQIYEDRPALLWSVVALLSQRLRTTDSALADSVFLDVTGRTAKRLLELAGDQDEFVLPVTQEELAGMVGRTTAELPDGMQKPVIHADYLSGYASRA